jgi:hypothetical protein
MHETNKCKKKDVCLRAHRVTLGYKLERLCRRVFVARVANEDNHELTELRKVKNSPLAVPKAVSICEHEGESEHLVKR